jgi:hypothetical protein
MAVLSRSLKNRWGFQVSYVLSKATGTLDNSGWSSWLQGNIWNGPSTALINTDGELGNSRRREFKAYVNYQVPRIDVMVSGIYTGMSGRPYTPYYRYSSGDLDIPGSSSRREIYLLPRGSERNDFYNNIDMRFEKIFNYGAHRFGVYAEFANLFNIASVTSRQTRYPSSGGVDYQSPTGVQGARQLTFGGRWSF